MATDPSLIYDVIIVGGGVIGSSIAYWLAANDDFNGRIAVVEKDSTYEFSSTARSNSSIRMQFSTALNIEISKFGIEFIRNADKYLTVNGETPHLFFVENGYLFLATTTAERETLLRNHRIQCHHGITDVLALGPKELKARFPWLNVEGVTCGTLGVRNEGWFDPFSLLQSFRRKARSLGVEYLEDEAIGFQRQASRIVAMTLKKAGTLKCGLVVNAAGAWSRLVAEMVGIEIPVVPRKRLVFAFSCRTKIQEMPLLIDPEGFYVRPASNMYLCGMKPPPENDPDCHDFEVDYDWFDDTLWPRLARWIPAFEAIKLERGWAGHYAYNTFDRNALLGVHPEVENLYFANGFSGHGMQQSPAIGRGMAELIAYGSYRSLDLSAFSIDRLIRNRPVIEDYVV